MGTLEAPDPTKIAKREDVDPNDASALRELAMSLYSSARNHEERAEELETRLSYTEDPSGEKSREDLKSERDHHAGRASRLMRESGVLKERAGNL